MKKNCKPVKTIVKQIVKSFSDMPEKEKREIITKATKASNKAQKELMEKAGKISFKDGLKIVKKIQKKVSEKECVCMAEELEISPCVKHDEHCQPDKTIVKKIVNCACKGVLKDANFHSDRRCSNKKLKVYEK